MAQKWKIDKVDELKEELKEYSNFVFTNYRGLNVEQLNGLRNTLREKGAGFHVIKNQYMKRVCNELGYKDLDQFLINPTALAYFNVDISEIAKILVNSLKDTSLELKGGYTDGLILSSDDVIKISRLPPKKVLITQTVGLLNTPISSFVFVLRGMLVKLVRILMWISHIQD